MPGLRLPHTGRSPPVSAVRPQISHRVRPFVRIRKPAKSHDYQMRAVRQRERSESLHARACGRPGRRKRRRRRAPVAAEPPRIHHSDGRLYRHGRRHPGSTLFAHFAAGAAPGPGRAHAPAVGSTMAASIAGPQIALTLALIVIAIGLTVMAVLTVTSSRAHFTAREAIYHHAMTQWNMLFYCPKCDCVFNLATRTSAPSSAMRTLLHPS